MQGCGVDAVQPPHETAIQPQRQKIAEGVGRLPRTDIAKSRQQRRPDKIAVAQHRCPFRQILGDAAQLPPVQKLTSDR